MPRQKKLISMTATKKKTLYKKSNVYECLAKHYYLLITIDSLTRYIKFEKTSWKKFLDEMDGQSGFNERFLIYLKKGSPENCSIKFLIQVIGVEKYLEVDQTRSLNWISFKQVYKVNVTIILQALGFIHVFHPIILTTMVINRIR